MANIQYIDGVAYKNINGVIHKLVGALWNNNNKLEKLGSFIYKDLLGRDQWIPIPDTNYTTIPLVKSMVDFNENRLANLVQVNITPALLTAWKGLITETGVNYNGVLGFPTIPGVQFSLAKNGFLTNGTEYTVSIKPIGNYAFTGVKAEIKITPTQFTPPAKVLIITQGIKNQVIADLKYTGENGKGTTISGIYPEYTVKVEPAGGAQSNGDTLKITLVPKNQVRLIGDAVIFHIIPANSFQNITHLTSSQIAARWLGTLKFTGYEGKGTIVSPQVYQFGQAIIKPNTGLSNGQEVSIDMIPATGYRIDDANQASGAFTGYKYNIPANTFVPDPATIISGNQEWDNVVSGLQYTSDGKVSSSYKSDHITYTITPNTGVKDGDTLVISVTADGGYTWVDVDYPTYTDSWTVPANSIPVGTVLARISIPSSDRVIADPRIYSHYVKPNGDVLFSGNNINPIYDSEVKTLKSYLFLRTGPEFVQGHYKLPNGNVVFYGDGSISVEYTDDLVTQVRAPDGTTIDLTNFNIIFGYYVKPNGNVVFYGSNSTSVEYTADLVTQVRVADDTTIDLGGSQIIGHYFKPNGNVVFYGSLSKSVEYTADLVTQVRATDQTTIDLGIGEAIYGHFTFSNGNVLFYGGASTSAEYTADLVTNVRPKDRTTIDIGINGSINGHYALPNGHILFYGGDLSGSATVEYALQ